MWNAELFPACASTVEWGRGETELHGGGGEQLKNVDDQHVSTVSEGDLVHSIRSQTNHEERVYDGF